MVRIRNFIGPHNFILLLAPFLLFAPVLLAGKALYWGTPALQFVPWRWYAWQSIRAGYLPLWNPLLGMGTPLLANYQSALFYPPNLIQYLLAWIGGVGWLAWSQALLVALHLAWAGLGMALLVRELGFSSLAQQLGGLAFGLSGYLVARSGFLTINAAAAWTPWVILALEKSTKGRGEAPLALVIGVQLLAGHAQLTWYTWQLAAIWALYMGWSTSHRHTAVTILTKPLWIIRLKGMLNACFMLGVGVLLGSALAAIQLLPTLEYLSQSHRSDQVSYELAMTYSFWPWRFLTLLAPHFFGNPAQGNYWGYGNYWEDAVYIGLLPLLLALGAAWSTTWLGRFPTCNSLVNSDLEKDTLSHPPLKSRSELTVILLIIIIGSFLLALGKNTPIFPWMFQHIPTFDMFQAPTRYTLWAVFSLSLLAAVGADGWSRPVGRSLYWARLWTAGAVSISIGAGLTLALNRGISLTSIKATAIVGIWSFLAGILWLIAPAAYDKSRSKAGTTGVVSWLNRERWSWVVVVVVAADLLSSNWELNPGVGQQFYKNIASASLGSGPQPAGRFYLHPDDEDYLKFSRYFRFDTFDLGENWRELAASLLPNLSLISGLPSVNNFDPLLPARYARWMEDLEKRSIDDPIRERLLNLMGVGVVETLDASTSPRVKFTTRDPAVRLRFVNCVLPASDSEEAWWWVHAGKIEIEHEAVLEDLTTGVAVGCDRAGSVVDQSPAHLEIVSEGPNDVTIRLRVDSDGWLILSDTWYPGWQATIDGVSTRIYRANYLFRAVRVTPGEHQVRFEYQPLSFWTGAFISIVVASAILAGLVRRRLPR